MSISPLYQRTECQICFMDPFEEDSELETCSWNGHHITAYEGLSSETRIIHGICQQCFPLVPVNAQLFKCFTCREPFPNRQRSLITVNREGVGIGALEPYLIKRSAGWVYLEARREREELTVIRGLLVSSVILTVASFAVGSELASAVFFRSGLAALGMSVAAVMYYEGRRGVQEIAPLP